MGMMKWNGMRGQEWKQIRVSVIEVDESKNGMGMDGNEWIEIIYANENEKQRCVVMRVIKVKQEGKEVWNNEDEGMINEMRENEF